MKVFKTGFNTLNVYITLFINVENFVIFENGPSNTTKFIFYLKYDWFFPAKLYIIYYVPIECAMTVILLTSEFDLAY